MTELENIGAAALSASVQLSRLTSKEKDDMLCCIADSIEYNISIILKKNKIDVDNAVSAGISSALKDRLTLNEDRIRAIADGIRKVAALPDPVGEVIEKFSRPNGLVIEKKRVPLGVIGIIYEARPNVTADTAVLCLKASNAVILRGGKEAINTNTVLVDIMRGALKKCGVDEAAVGFVKDTSRESANEMMKLNKYIDVLIPRGGAGLINAVVQNATVPVIQTGVGNCHIYVDKSADIKKAVDITVNAKTSRPSVCNAAETLLIHKDVSDEFYELLQKEFDKFGVKIIGCEKTMNKLKCARQAEDVDFATEFLDYAISVKIVNDVDEAIAHISRYSTKHSECIIAEDKDTADKFTACIDAAAVYVNASTRFTDGFEFGFGAEIGISTQKLHARGPMGLKELTSYKYIVNGNGQIRV